MLTTKQVRDRWDAGEISDVEALMHLLCLHSKGCPAALAILATIVVDMNDREEVATQEAIPAFIH